MTAYTKDRGKGGLGQSPRPQQGGGGLRPQSKVHLPLPGQNPTVCPPLVASGRSLGRSVHWTLRLSSLIPEARGLALAPDA